MAGTERQQRTWWQRVEARVFAVLDWTDSGHGELRPTWVALIAFVLGVLFGAL